MKILILFDIARRADPEETFAERALKEEDKPTELDVLKCLKRLGHEVETLAVFDNVAAIVEKLTAYAPDVVFNLTESFYHDRSHEPNIPALLELMKVRYTGSGPEALLLCKDKALAKQVLTYHKVRLPRFVVSHKARPLRRLRRFTFPAFVKPVSEESSDGISQASLVKGEEEAIERARSGGGPTVIEALTYRMGDHTTADDASRYRKEERVSAAWKLDPLARLRTYLVNQSWWTKEDEEKLIAACREKIEAAVAEYLAIPPPSPAAMFDHLFETLPPSLEWQRKKYLGG
jgi:D-alanine-D-alanine ligase-like ATP-grasp enzyme